MLKLFIKDTECSKSSKFTSSYSYARGSVSNNKLKQRSYHSHGSFLRLKRLFSLNYALSRAYKRRSVNLFVSPPLPSEPTQGYCAELTYFYISCAHASTVISEHRSSTSTPLVSAAEFSVLARSRQFITENKHPV